jgi:small GTP-binding protein
MTEETKEEIDYEIMPEDTPIHDISFKLIAIGDPGVGKSCLTMKATKNIFENDYSPTIGFEFYTFIIKIKEKIIRLQIWDTCGQEVYRSLINSFFRNSSLAILIYGINNLKSFKNLEFWLNDIKMNSNPDIKIFLVGNKKDLEEKREVPIDKAKTFYKEHNLHYFLETSAKTGFNVQKLLIRAAIVLYEESKNLEMKTSMVKNTNENNNNTNSINNNNTNDNNIKLTQEGDTETDLNDKPVKRNNCC